MMELAIRNESGTGAGTVAVSDSAFGAAFNPSLVHQVVTAYLAGARAGTKAQKTRSEVSGGGSKPWRQKGTGRARAGTIRSPIWRGGGITFAARPRSYVQKVNRKMYRAALRAICSELARQERLVVVDEFDLEAPKTARLAARLKGLGLGETLIVVDAPSDNLLLAARNIPGVDVRDVANVDPVGLVAFEHVLVSVAALKKLEEQLA